MFRFDNTISTTHSRGVTYNITVNYPNGLPAHALAVQASSLSSNAATVVEAEEKGGTVGGESRAEEGKKEEEEGGKSEIVGVEEKGEESETGEDEQVEG